MRKGHSRLGDVSRYIDKVKEYEVHAFNMLDGTNVSRDVAIGETTRCYTSQAKHDLRKARSGISLITMVDFRCSKSEKHSLMMSLSSADRMPNNWSDASTR